MEINDTNKLTLQIEGQTDMSGCHFQSSHTVLPAQRGQPSASDLRLSHGAAELA